MQAIFWCPDIGELLPSTGRTEYCLKTQSVEQCKASQAVVLRVCRKDSAILSRSLTEFYDDKGFLHEEKFAAEVQKLLTDFEKSYSNKLISGLEKGYKKVK